MIKYLKLINGEELIASISWGLFSYKLTNPLVVTQSRLSDGQLMVALGPYALGGVKSIKVRKSSVLSITDCVPEIARFYYNSLSFNIRHVYTEIINTIAKSNDTMEEEVKKRAQKTAEQDAVKEEKKISGYVHKGSSTKN